MDANENLRKASRRVMSDFSRRQDGLVELTEASLSHVMRKRDCGFVVMSACRGNDDWVEREIEKIGGRDGEKFKGLSVDERNVMLDNRHWNNVRTKELAADLKASGLGFIPVYGGYREDSGITEFERSFLVAPMNRDRKDIPFDELVDKCAALAAKYRQETILVVPPDGGAPYWLATTTHKSWDGSLRPAGTVVQTFGRKFVLNDLLQTYFTALNKVATEPEGSNDPNPRRFTLTDESTHREFAAYMPEPAPSYYVRYSRYIDGVLT